MADFNHIDQARKLLGLNETATLQEIKSAYKGLARRYHPDRNNGTDDATEAMKDLNWAYQLLMGYCNDYKYSFDQEDVARTYPQEEYLRRFYYGWFDNI
jgi:DnaJ-class molecular chaperone